MSISLLMSSILGGGGVGQKFSLYIYIYIYIFLAFGLFCSKNKSSMKGELSKSLIVYTYIRFQMFSRFSDCFILMHYLQNIKIN